MIKKMASYFFALTHIFGKGIKINYIFLPSEIAGSASRIENIAAV
jgi:hypothetical protein